MFLCVSDRVLLLTGNRQNSWNPVVLEFLLHSPSSAISTNVKAIAPVTMILGLAWQHRKRIRLMQFRAKALSFCLGDVTSK